MQIYLLVLKNCFIFCTIAHVNIENTLAIISNCFKYSNFSITTSQNNICLKLNLDTKKGIYNIPFETCKSYLFENCGARRAFFKPGFLRSFLRASLVINPLTFNTLRKLFSLSAGVVLS